MKLRGMVAATLLVLALAGCSAEADMPTIEKDIAADIEDQADVTGVTVDCPESIEWRVGEDFRCIAESGGDRAQVTVHMENDDMEYSWETSSVG